MLSWESEALVSGYDNKTIGLRVKANTAQGEMARKVASNLTYQGLRSLQQHCCCSRYYKSSIDLRSMYRHPCAVRDLRALVEHNSVPAVAPGHVVHAVRGTRSMTKYAGLDVIDGANSADVAE
jgi:hypothetical protein